MKRIFIALAALAAIGCSKEKLECKTVFMTRENTCTGEIDTVMNNRVVCANGLYFLKKDGTKEGCYITHTTFK